MYLFKSYVIQHNTIQNNSVGAKVNSNEKRFSMALYTDVQTNICVFKLLNDFEIYILYYAAVSSINFCIQNPSQNRSPPHLCHQK